MPTSAASLIASCQVCDNFSCWSFTMSRRDADFRLCRECITLLNNLLVRTVIQNNSQETTNRIITTCDHCLPNAEPLLSLNQESFSELCAVCRKHIQQKIDRATVLNAEDEQKYCNKQCTDCSKPVPPSYLQACYDAKCAHCGNLSYQCNTCMQLLDQRGKASFCLACRKLDLSQRAACRSCYHTLSTDELASVSTNKVSTNNTAQNSPDVIDQFCQHCLSLKEALSTMRPLQNLYGF
jgi:hypothetical protein